MDYLEKAEQHLAKGDGVCGDCDRDQSKGVLGEGSSVPPVRESSRKATRDAVVLAWLAGLLMGTGFGLMTTANEFANWYFAGAAGVFAAGLVAFVATMASCKRLNCEVGSHRPGSRATGRDESTGEGCISDDR